MTVKTANDLGRYLAQLMERHPYRASLLLSLLASLLALSSRGIVNSDGVFFLTIAEKIARDGLAAVFQQNGPVVFYSLLIHWGAKLSGLGHLWVADLLNASLFALAGVAFAGLLRALHATPFQLLLGIWLFALFPVVNEIRADLYRDAGYFAFALTALWCYLDADVSRRLSSKLLALLCVLTASLFRFEALALLAYPLTLLVSRRRLFIILPLAGLGLLMSSDIHLALRGAMKALSVDMPIAEPIIRKINDMMLLQTERFGVLANEVLNKHSSKHAEGFYLFGCAYLLLAAVFSNLRWHLVYLLASAVGLRGKYNSRGLGVAILVLSVPLAFQTYFGGFLQARYAILISILLIAFLILHYGSLLRPDNGRKKALMALFVLVFLVDSFVSTGPSRNYQQEAVDWVQEHIPVDQRVISNRRSLSYTMGRLSLLEDGMKDDAGCDTIARYDFYAHLSGRRTQDTPECAQRMQVVKTFTNGKGDTITLFSTGAQQP